MIGPRVVTKSQTPKAHAVAAEEMSPFGWLSLTVISPAQGVSARRVLGSFKLEVKGFFAAAESESSKPNLHHCTGYGGKAIEWIYNDDDPALPSDVADLWFGITRKRPTSDLHSTLLFRPVWASSRTQVLIPQGA